MPTLLTALFLIAMLFGGSCRPAAPPPGPPGTATVIEVLDGDTLEVVVSGRNERVRLLGIDTPESSHGLRPPECGGDPATKRTEQLLPPGTAIRLERDIEARDRYDRLLAWVHRVDDGLFINLALVAEGQAVTLTIEPNVTHAGLLLDAEGQARDSGLGLWGNCGGGDTPLDQGATNGATGVAR